VRAYKASKSETLEHARYDRMFVPLDGSKRAEYALNTAVALSRFFDAKLVLGHVIARPEMPLQIPLTDDDRGLIERYVDRVKEAITKYFGSLQARSLIEFESRLRVNDDIAASLHDMVEAERTDMVVLCAHGYSGKRKWPFGGVTTSFIEYGTTPLLMIQDLRPDEVELTEAEKAAEETKGH
jgi:nucleotide-binding universal stress UspA family protein